MAAPNQLSEMHRKLVTHFLNGMTKHEAALAAGYSESVAEKAYLMFNRDDVKTEIVRRQKQMSSKAGVDADWIIAKLKAIANADVADLYILDQEGLPRVDLNRLRGDLRTALTGYNVNREGKISVGMADKLKALDMLAKHLGMYQDKVTLEGELTLVERLQAGRERASGGTSTEKGASNS